MSIYNITTCMPIFGFTVNVSMLKCCRIHHIDDTLCALCLAKRKLAASLGLFVQFVATLGWSLFRCHLSMGRNQTVDEYYFLSIILILVIITCNVASYLRCHYW